ncbi:MAG: TonB family protein [Gemmatimonadota bacterium]|nr:TonB family protein [Gemmatimonadota bacterium]
MRDGARPDRGVGAMMLAAALALGCADTVRPVIGALKIGASADRTFVMPMLESEQLPFEYPKEAWSRGVGGETVLRLHIATTGIVDTVAVAESSGDRTLDSAAVAAARRLRYRPAHRGDEPVAVWAYLPVRYPMPARSDEDGGR